MIAAFRRILAWLCLCVFFVEIGFDPSTSFVRVHPKRAAGKLVLLDQKSLDSFLAHKTAPDSAPAPATNDGDWLSSGPGYAHVSVLPPVADFIPSVSFDRVRPFDAPHLLHPDLARDHRPPISRS